MAVPGITSYERVELPFVKQLVMVNKVTIDAQTRDTANTGKTTELRAGLILAYHTVDTHYRHFVQGGSGGQETARCILLESVDISDGVDKEVMVMWMGEAQSSKLPNYHADAIADLNAGPDDKQGYILFSS